MDSIIRTIIEKRNKLGWSNKLLAKKSNVPYSAIVRMEKGIGYWEDYVALMDSSLNKAIDSLAIDKFIQSLPAKEKNQNTDTNKYPTSTNDENLTNIKPLRKRSEWALRYSQCIKCGSSDKPHISRGLCKSCYDKDIEKRHKDIERIQNK